ncbi:Ribokinase [Bacillus sp. THAF10]|uniref:ribokinase n=1 Tax=Bacillus sp. THAF10 TaxID=2587848 RepID=UPI001268A772|nr:ribokinase [Bacillus sp. THAF10]QFT90762.1 Ribokinase [Bacillus sp. THAF10]
MAKIVVVGSYVVDLTARTPHMPKAGETVLGGPFRMGPGGKGSNQAVAAARLGAKVTMVTKVGKDLFGEDALRNFTKEGIETKYISQVEEESTGAALIAVDDEGENMIVVSLGACGTITEQEVLRAEDAFLDADMIMLQLETSLEAVTSTINLAKKLGKPVILNPAPYQNISDDLLKKVTFLTPNETEAGLLTGVEVTDETTAQEAAAILLSKGVEVVILTLGKKGCYLLKQGEEQGKLIPGHVVKAVDTTGAGDAFNGAFAHFLAEGCTIEAACVKANKAAALSVTKHGTAPAMPYLTDLE